MFHLGYHLHWGFTEIMDLPTLERREFLKLLIETIEKQNEAVERARRSR